MCNHTLEHVSYPVDFMKLLYDIGSENTYYYIEVPSENPFMENKYSIVKNLRLFFNPMYNKIKLIRHYMHLKKQPYMPMTEHVNFYTPKALEILMIRSGFEVLDIEENYEQNMAGKAKILSVLCKKK